MLREAEPETAEHEKGKFFIAKSLEMMIAVAEPWPRDVHVLIPRTYAHVTTAKGLEMGRLRVLKSSRSFLAVLRRRWQQKTVRCSVAGLEDGGRGL